jgi:ribokinase
MANDASGAIRVIVPGALNTDIIAVGVPYLAAEGEDLYARELIITAGGKARNIAEMIAVLTGPGTVAMLSRTSRDPFGLWKPPVEALDAVGVNTDCVFVAEYTENDTLPGIALVTVDTAGRRNASIYNAILADFSAADIDRARSLLEAAARNSGFLVLTLEIPVKTAYAISVAVSLGLRVILDPGGLRHDAVPDDLFGQPIYLIKPNEHEAKLLSGIDVTGHESATHAAAILRDRGAENVLITHGAQGGYLIGDGVSEHIPVPTSAPVGQADATGCGDQVTAAVSASLCDGATLPSAARFGIVAGTMQFSRVGVQPLTRADMRGTAAYPSRSRHLF